MSLGLKQAAKRWTRNTLSRSGVFGLAGRLHSARAVILGYHSILEKPEEFTNVIGLGIIHSAAAFKRQMELIAHKFNPISLSDISMFLRGEKLLPPRAVAVTFDDGYVDNFQVAEPILRHYGVPASFYLTVNLIGTGGAPWFNKLRHAFYATHMAQWWDGSQFWNLSTPQHRERALQVGFAMCSSMPENNREETIKSIENCLAVETFIPKSPLMMDWEQARKLQAAGHIVGSHTLSHPNLAHVEDSDMLHRELVESKRTIEDELGIRVDHFSYPHPALHPQWTGTTRAATRNAGYKTAVTTDPGPVISGSNALSLRRMIVPRYETDFRWRLDCTFLGVQQQI